MTSFYLRHFLTCEIFDAIQMEIVSDLAVVAVVTFALQHLICISTV
jgi:hypothetical protein